MVGIGALTAGVLARRRKGWRRGAMALAATEFLTAGTRYCPVNRLLGIDTRRGERGKGIRVPEAVDFGRTFRGHHELTADLTYQRLGIVNVVFWGSAEHWVLIDAGIPGSAGRIRKAAEARFGRGAKPAAIILTHGHFDHVGALRELAEGWDSPIYAHALELPYLTGQSSYPPPDPTVGGGMMARLSPMYPRGPVDVSSWVKALPGDGSVPGMDGWRWLHTPGHTPGHVSLWREGDRFLIAGDAFITTRQESAYAVARQMPEVNGPPKYYTQDWEQAEESVRRLAALRPEAVVTGHGPAMRGTQMLEALEGLALEFEQRAVPASGRSVAVANDQR